MARLSVAHYGRVSQLVLGRFGRQAAARLSWNSFALWRLWPGRTDRLVIAPQDLRTADATRAAEIYAGRFVFAGKIVTCHGRSPFDLVPPSPEWDVALLGFGWLRHLRAADSPITRANARALVEEWISNRGQSSPRAWRADVLARRIISLLSQAPLVLNDTDGRFYRRFLRSLAREIRYLRYMMLDAADGVPRLQAHMALCYASLCLHNHARHIKSTTRRLADELQRQVLPDGGHISRSPAAVIELLLDLLPLRQTFAARNIAPPPALLNAIDRMMPMLRFFRHPDGNLALFNGMGSTPSDLVATLLAYDDSHGTPMSGLPHSGFQRIDAGTTTIIMDTGAPPPTNVSHDAHAGTLAFEMSSGGCRMVVNSGMPANGRDDWRAFARSTPAHSTLVYHEESSSEFVGPGAMKRLLQGSPIVAGPSKVEAYREAIANGILLTTSHDGYARRFGIAHRRVLMMAIDGNRLDGEDMIERVVETRIKQGRDDYALRFHLHPQIKASKLRDGRGVMLVLPNRDVWTFEAMDDTVELEDSVFLAGSDGPRRSAQIVIRQTSKQAASVRWAFVRTSPGTTQAQARRSTRQDPELPL
jgi:uncharacterized heparinase superfamily protein